MKVWENSKKFGNTCLWLVFPQHSSFSQTFTCVSITRCFLFLKLSFFDVMALMIGSKLGTLRIYDDNGDNDV